MKPQFTKEELDQVEVEFEEVTPTIKEVIQSFTFIDYLFLTALFAALVVSVVMVIKCYS